jgi:CheY-like chemotaxis protein
MFQSQTILLVDDSENDRMFMRIAFRKVNFTWPIHELHDGDEVIAYLKGDGPYAERHKFPLPAVILLDLNMPKSNGFEVLKWVRAQEQFKLLQVIVVTASTRPDDVRLAYCLGANSFLVKPATIDELVKMVGCLRDWLQMNQFAPVNDAVGRR